MLIPIPILCRDSASEPAIEKTIALNPDCIARVEDSEEGGIVRWWADGMQGPHKTKGTVAEFAAYINGYIFGDDEEEPCEPEN